MALTEVEKAKIQEEEAFRAQVRTNLSQVKSTDSPASPKKKGIGCGGIIGIMLLISLVGGIIASTKNPRKEPTAPSRQLFKAEIKFSGTQFYISNLDDLDCQNAKIEINGGIGRNGYTLEGYTLEAGKSYTVGAMQFTNNDGTRFNPVTTKPFSPYIFCYGTNELNGAVWNLP